MTSSFHRISSQLGDLERAGRESLSQREAAAALGWTLARVRSAVYEDRIPHYALGSSVRIPRAAIEAIRAAESSRKSDAAQEEANIPNTEEQPHA